VAEEGERHTRLERREQRGHDARNELLPRQIELLQVPWSTPWQLDGPQLERGREDEGAKRCRPRTGVRKGDDPSMRVLGRSDIDQHGVVDVLCIARHRSLILGAGHIVFLISF
jgi:hypothetical protein